MNKYWFDNLFERLSRKLYPFIHRIAKTGWVRFGKRVLLTNFILHRHIKDDELRQALAYAYNYCPDIRPLVDQAEVAGIGIAWSSLAENTGSLMDWTSRRILISTDHHGNSIGSLAARLAHEFYHANRPYFGFYEDHWLEEEEAAFSWECKVWSSVPEECHFRPNGYYHQWLNELTERWRNGTLKEYILNSPAYKDQKR